MALRTTEEANRLIGEAVLLTAQIKTALDDHPGMRNRIGDDGDNSMAAATLASTIISTFGGSILSRSLFREVDDSELPPAEMTAPPRTMP